MAELRLQRRFRIALPNRQHPKIMKVGFTATVHGTLLCLLLILAAPLANARDAETKTGEAETTEAQNTEQKTEQKTEQAQEEYYELLELFVDSLDQIERNYVREVSRRELMEAAIEGMIEKLDPHSSYVAPEEVRQFRSSVENRFGGIGIHVTIEGDELTVVSPLVGAPAYEAGVQAGDRILEIEGESAIGITLDEAVKKLKGEVGTEVTITVRNGAAGEPRKITIRRAIVEVETVLGNRRKADDSWDYFLDHQQRIGYCRVNSFSRATARDLRRVLKKLKDQDVQGLVLDLRFNPGGLLTSAIEVCDMFVDKGRIVSTKGRNTRERTWNAKTTGTFEDFPMVVLINRYSASASEIVSACLQDHGRAIVVGERSYGKGSVQNVIELEDGKSVLKLTTASYWRPNGKNIHRFPDSTDEDEWGVTPTDENRLRLSTEEIQSLLDFRRTSYIARGTKPAIEDLKLANPPEPAPKDAPGDDAQPEDGPRKNGEDPAGDENGKPADDGGVKQESDEQPAEQFVDRHLQRALSYLSSELARAETEATASAVNPAP